MKRLVFVLFLVSRMADAQGALPWGGQALSVPLLATQAGTALFYVSAYTRVGGHTDYDMARQAADAYLTDNPRTPTYLVLGPALTETCDAVPLPSVSRGDGTSSTVSIIGYGSRVSNITKAVGCAASSATLRVSESTNGPIINAWYQGFTVSANHIDAAACGFYGISNSTILDVACGNAVPGADHEVEFGNPSGQVDNISIFNLKAFDNVGGGRGAVLTPQWSAGGLAGAVLGSGATTGYTQQYTRARLVGPGLSSCTTVTALAPIVSSLATVTYPSLPTVVYGFVTGATVIKAGSCSKTAQIYILIQDGVPVMYGMKFTNMVMSRVWNLESTASSYYGEAWLRSSVRNAIVGEHTYTNQTIQVLEYGALNSHFNAFFDSPGEYGAVIYGESGSFSNSIFSWDSTTYLAASGYYLGSATYQKWAITNSQCTNSSANFVSMTTPPGPLLATDPPPSGVTFKDIENCNGTNVVDWPTQVGPQ
jgi:hypothetical protein